MLKEEKRQSFQGFYPLALSLVLLFLTGYYLNETMWITALSSGLIALFMLPGFFTLEPNEGAVLTLFGKYQGSIKKSGFHWVFPLLNRRKISLRLRNHHSEKIKVNDANGNPIEISIILIWQVVDTAKALFEINNVEEFVKSQSESALRQMTSLYPYDLGHENAKSSKASLRGSMSEVTAQLSLELKERLQRAGVSIVEARINHLAYSPEIAQVMLRRQAAEAIIHARTKIVEGAVGMVEMALTRLSAKNIVQLDEERKAAMVSNLLVVLCGESEAQPVINTGTLYH